ncbi:3-ketoacyl-ACP reductase [Rhodococcus sp. SC4]|nr:3-ketoacyl-ACP reductase [Rhodococcus sp. SC4]
MGRMDGKTAFITGAARGQGRAHAIRLAQEGADIIATDIAEAVDTVTYKSATLDDLEYTVKEVEKLGRRVISYTADVRDSEGLQQGLNSAVAELGRLDVVIANAGIINSVEPSWEIDESDWRAIIDVNLTGVWQTTKAAVPHLIEAKNGGSIILISSVAGLQGIPNMAHYDASKYGVRGLAQALANELSPHQIRVNSIHPSSVRTPMIDSGLAQRTYRPDLENATFEDCYEVMCNQNMWDVPYIEADDVANAALFLASEESRYVTGIALPVDLGWTAKFSGA